MVSSFQDYIETNNLTTNCGFSVIHKLFELVFMSLSFGASNFFII